MSAGRPRRPRPPERELLEAVAARLRDDGYRTVLDPDGSDYFDLAARRGDEVGLVEGKVGQPSAVLAQALRRRPWADWLGVVVGSEVSARRLAARTRDHRSAIVGVWSYERGSLQLIRAPGTTHPAGEPDPFAPLRERFRRLLEALDDGRLPAGVRWSGVGAELRRASGGRGFAEWRLDELEGPAR